MSDYKNKIIALRERLLDLTGRNGLISFRHSPKSRRYVRVIDEIPSIILKKLEMGKSLQIVPLPEPDTEPLDEKTPVFQEKFEQEKSIDEEYLKALSELGDDPSSRAEEKIEAQLRDRVRLALGMAKINRGDPPDPSVSARAIGIRPDYELLTEIESQSSKHRDDILQTLYFPEDLDRRLRLIYEQSRLAESETGVNTLHLSIGFLEWYDSNDSDTPIISPLLLFPVQVNRRIEQESYVYKVEPREEEAATNICLRERLKKDFNIILPPPGDEEELDTYLARILELVKNLPHWKVRRFVTLGFFAFSKLVMHEDLGDASWVIEEESLVAKLLEGNELHDTGNVLFAEDYQPDLPEFQIKIPMLALDADSSQISALIDVMDGKNLVIEGPPGTGKSQTIANIIAAAMSQGKAVLFVAEKTAALAAVKRYLDKADLGTFCLELHSNKSRRADVLKSISDTLKLRSLSQPDVNLDLLLKRQNEIREEIGHYLFALHSKHGDLGHNCRDLIWRYSKVLAECPDIFNKLQDLSIQNIMSLSIEQFDRTLSALSELARLRKELFSDHTHMQNHPWFGLANEYLNPLTEQDLIRGAQSLLRQTNEFLTDIAAITILRIAPQGRTIASLRAQLKLIDELTPPPTDAFAKCYSLFEREEDKQALEQYLQNRQVHIQGKLDLVQWFEVGATVSIIPQESFTSLINASSDRLIPWTTFDDLDRRLMALREKSITLENAARLRNSLGNSGLNISTSEQLIDAVQIIATIKENSEAYFKYKNHPGLAANSIKTLENAFHQIERYKKLEESLGQFFRLDLNTDVTTIRNAAITIMDDGFWSFLKGDLRRCKRFIQEISCISTEKPPAEISKLLNTYANFLDLEAAIETSADLRLVAGSEFLGIRTPVAELLKSLRFILSLEEVCLAGPPEWPKAMKQWCATLTSDTLQSLQQESIKSFRQLASEMRMISSDASPIDDELRKVSNTLSRGDLILRLGRECRLRSSTSFEQIQPILDRIREMHLSEATIESLVINNETIRRLHSTNSVSMCDLQLCLNYANFVASTPFSEVERRCLISKDGLTQLELIHSLSSEHIRIANELETQIESFAVNLTKGNLKKRFEVEGVSAIDLDQLTQVLSNALVEPALLSPFYTYLRSYSELGNQYIADLVGKWERSEYDFDELPLAYQALTISELLKSALSTFPDLSRKFGPHLDGLRDEFRKNDRALLTEYCKKLRKQLFNKRVPPGITRGKPKELTERGLLDHEISKKMKHVPIRDLMKRSISAVRAIKPCFMMSPLSVAQFLPSQIPVFDLVVMDEASQLRIEDVIGSLLRGSQAIIVGDPHQLPPTSFFSFAMDDGTNEEEQDVGLDHESVLDLALKTYRPARRLKWHYRSRHQNLIAYSNQEFYDRELIIFPSPYDYHPDFGFEYVPCDGVYDKRRNLIEAKKVIEAAARHMAEHSDLSLGVVTMNQEQKELIRDLLDTQLKTDPVMQAFLARWEESAQREPFFVKNLENVQGDERDVIIVSTVYGRDPSGNFYQRFGPINGPVGHRRLNVLFTRAKCKVTILSSIEPEWILVEKNSSRGLKVFRGFLEFAKTGRLPVFATETGAGTDSPFEDFVLKALKDRGYDIATQVGVAGYFIDLAVRDPMRPGRFALGIECDGKTYHSGRSARDRDRLRQENLERLGWHIYRIWSTDWFTNPDLETEKLIRVIERRFSDSQNQSSAKKPDVPVPKSVIKIDKDLTMTSNADAPVRSVINGPESKIVNSITIQKVDKNLKLTSALCRNVIIWNRQAKRMTTTLDIGLLGKLESVDYFLSRNKTVDKAILEDAQRALSKAISLGFDPNKTYG